jgi:GNAT superfamily N-acetyltransferase
MAADRASGGLVARAATLDDLEAVTALFARCDLDELGVEDTTVADVLAEWRRPGFDLASDTFLIEAPGGRVVAYGHVYEGREGDGYVDPGHRARGHGTWLLRRAAARAREQLAAAGRDRGRLEAWTNHADASFRRLLEREGYRPYRSQLIMRVDLDPTTGRRAGCASSLWPPPPAARVSGSRCSGRRSPSSSGAAGRRSA